MPCIKIDTWPQAFPTSPCAPGHFEKIELGTDFGKTALLEVTGPLTQSCCLACPSLVRKPLRTRTPTCGHSRLISGRSVIPAFHAGRRLLPTITIERRCVRLPPLNHALPKLDLTRDGQIGRKRRETATVSGPFAKRTAGVVRLLSYTGSSHDRRYPATIRVGIDTAR